jgi:hypothetical protein
MSSSISLSISPSTPLPTSHITELATSGALDEISNAPSAVREYIRNRGLVREESKTNRALLFVIYQTGRHGPQNGFRLCLVHEGFVVEGPEAEEVFGKAEDVVGQGVMEFIRLGSPSAAMVDL